MPNVYIPCAIKCICVAVAVTLTILQFSKTCPYGQHSVVSSKSVLLHTIQLHDYMLRKGRLMVHVTAIDFITWLHPYHHCHESHMLSSISISNLQVLGLQQCLDVVRNLSVTANFSWYCRRITRCKHFADKICSGIFYICMRSVDNSALHYLRNLTLSQEPLPMSPHLSNYICSVTG